MTYRQFLAILTKTPRGWSIDRDGGIRLRPSLSTDASGAAYGTDCPVLAVLSYGHFASPLEGGYPSQPIFKSDIWAAADNAPDHDPEVRLDLLEACGLLDRYEEDPR